MGSLNGKYAVVTGGGKGIGAAIVKRYMQEGAAGIAIWDYDAELAKKTAAEIGGNIIICQCDISKDGQVKDAVDATLSAFGRIDILVNNAGITRDVMFHKMTDDQWSRVIDINLNGLYFCCKHVVPLMREQNYGKIVNLSSSSAAGNAGQANYAATKAGIIGFTKTLAKELGAKNITANAIAPAMIDTDMMRSVPENLLKSYVTMIPARRLGSVDELAAAALFLGSDDSSFVNGIVLPVNGGMFT